MTADVCALPCEIVLLQVSLSRRPVALLGHAASLRIASHTRPPARSQSSRAVDRGDSPCAARFNLANSPASKLAFTTPGFRLRPDCLVARYGLLPAVVPSAGGVTYWALGGSAALLLFVSGLVHELSHSLIARSRGLKVDSITLFIFGGVSNLTTEATTPGDEFFVAVVGPVSNIVLAGIFWALGRRYPAPVRSAPWLATWPSSTSYWVASTWCRDSRSTADACCARWSGAPLAICSARRRPPHTPARP